MYYRQKSYALSESTLFAVVISHWLHATPPAATSLLLFRSGNETIVNRLRASDGRRVPDTSWSQNPTIKRLFFVCFASRPEIRSGGGGPVSNFARHLNQ